MSALLSVRGLEARYGASRILFGIDLDVAAGEVVALLGRNGMGKTTSVRAILGLLAPAGGTVHFAGAAIAGWPAHRIARAGIGLVPEGRRIFPNLTVTENLVATARPGPWTLARVHDLFPRLSERGSNMGNQLSGGEQQMLAIGRALMTNPDLMILDEATEGLAPRVVAEIWRTIALIRASGIASLIVDRNYRAVLAHCDRGVVLEKGVVVLAGPARDLLADEARLQRHLGV